MLIYIAGPYRAQLKEDIDANIDAAREIAIKVWEAGHVAICPHLNTAHFERDCDLQDEDYLKGDLKILARCDAVLIIPGWRESAGTLKEGEFAFKRKIPIYFYPNMPEKHPTEIKRPQQVAAFIDTIMRMYRVHLDKNADYSPANILGTGQVGLVTRLWDKMARLMNLTGFQIEISEATFTTPIDPKCESLDDTGLDLANYGVIFDIHRKGAWGK